MERNNGGNAKTRAADQDAPASWSKANKKKKLKKKRTRSEPRHTPPDTTGGKWQDKQSRYPKGTIARPPEERMNPKSTTNTIKLKKRPEPARTLRRRPVKDPDPPKRHPKPANAEEEKMRAIKKAKNVEDVKRMLLDKDASSQKRTLPRTNKSRVSPSPPSSPDPPVDQKDGKASDPTKSEGKSLFKDLFKSKDKSKDHPKEKTQTISQPHEKPPTSKEPPLSRETSKTKETEKSSESLKPTGTNQAPTKPERASSDIAKSSQKHKEQSGLGSVNRRQPNTPKDVSISLDPSDTSLLPNALNKSGVGSMSRIWKIIDVVNLALTVTLFAVAVSMSESNTAATSENRALLDSIPSTPKLNDETMTALEALAANLTENNRLDESISQQVYDLETERNKTEERLDKLLQRYEQIEKSINEKTEKIAEDIEFIEREVHNLNEQEKLLTDFSESALERIGSIESKEKDMINEIEELKGKIGENTERITDSDSKFQYTLDDFMTNNMTTLSTALEDNEKIMNELKSSIASLKTEQTEVDNKLKSISDAEEELENTLELLNETVETLRSNQNETNDQMQELTDANDKLTADLQDLKRDSENFKSEIDESVAFREDMNGFKSKSAKDMEDLSTELINEKGEMDDMKQKIDDITGKQREYGRESDGIQQKLSQLQQKHSDIEDEIKSLKRRSTNVQTENKVGSQAANDIRNDLYVQEEKIERLEDGINEIKLSLIDIQGAQEEASSSISKLDDDHETAIQEIMTTIAKTDSELENIKEQLKTQLNNHGMQAEELRRDVNNINKELDDLSTASNSKIDDLSNKVNSVKSQQEEYSRASSKYATKDSMDRVNDEVERLEDELASNAQNQAQNDEVQNEKLDHISNKLSNIDQLTATVANTESGLQTANDRLEEYRSSMTSLSGQVENHEEQLANMQSVLEDGPVSANEPGDAPSSPGFAELERQMEQLSDEVADLRSLSENEPDNSGNEKLLELQDKIRTLNDTMKETKDHLDSMNAGVDNEGGNAELLTEVKEQLSNHNDEIDEIKLRLADTQSTIAKIDTDNSKPSDRSNGQNAGENTDSHRVIESHSDKIILSEKLEDIEEMINAVNSSVTENRIESSQLRALVTNLTDDYASVIDRLHTIKNEEGSNNDNGTVVDIDDTVESILESKSEHLKKELSPSAIEAGDAAETVNKSQEVLSKSDVQEIVSAMLDGNVRDTEGTAYDNAKESPSDSELDNIKQKLQSLSDDFSDTTDSMRDELRDLREQIAQSNLTNRLSVGGDSTSENQIGDTSVREELDALHNQIDRLNSTLHKTLSSEPAISGTTTTEGGEQNITDVRDLDRLLNDFKERISALEGQRTVGTDETTGVDEAIPEVSATEGNVSASSDSDIHALRQDISELQAICDELEEVTSNNMTEFRQELDDIERIVNGLEAGGGGAGGTDPEKFKELEDKVQTQQDQLMNMNKGFRQVFEDIFARDNDQEQRLKRITDIQQYQFRMLRTMEMKLNGQG